jgi:hypothetical protein
MMNGSETTVVGIVKLALRRPYALVDLDPDHLNTAKVGKLQQHKNSYPRIERYLSGDLAIDVLPPTTKWFRLSLPFLHQMLARAAWLADCERI